MLKWPKRRRLQNVPSRSKLASLVTPRYSTATCQADAA